MHCYRQHLKFAAVFTVALLLGFLSSWYAPALAMETVPAGVREWILKQDPKAEIREDGWVKLSTGDEFIVVQPSEKRLVPDAIKVSDVHSTDDVPDVVVFNDGHYLLRVIPLENGEKTLPVLQEASAILKSAHLPENLKLPKNLYIPSDWKPLLLPEIHLAGSDATGAKADGVFFWQTGSSLYEFKNTTPLTVTRVLNLPCTPAQQHGVLPLSSNNDVLLSCLDRAEAFHLHFDQEVVQVTQKLTLAAVPTDAVYDAKSGRVFFAHRSLSVPSQEAPKKGFHGWFRLKSREEAQQVANKKQTMVSALSVYDTKQRALLNNVTVSEPIEKLYLSDYRRQIFALTASRQALLVLSADTPASGGQKLSLQMPIKDWAVQYDKVLWLLSDDNTLQGFDMRWQDLSASMPLSGLATQLWADARWVYVLMPEAKQIQRFSQASLLDPNAEGIPEFAPITLSADCRVSIMVGDSVNDAMIVSEPDCGRLAIVSAPAAGITGYLTHDVLKTFASSGHYVAGVSATGESWLPQQQQATLKFRDGRVLIQSGLSTPPVK